MKRLDYLLWLVAEEAVEVAQRASKAARFGLEEVQPGQEQNNALRMFGELADLLTAFDMLTEESAVMRQANLDAGKVVVETRKAKRAKTEKFMLYSITDPALNDCNIFSFLTSKHVWMQQTAGS